MNGYTGNGTNSLHIRAPMDLLLASALTIMLAGCGRLPGDDQGITAGIGVDNKTNLELKFEVFLDGRWYRPPGLAHPGNTFLVMGMEVLPASGCTAGALVALTEDGREVARHDAPLCVGDLWTIEEPSTDPSSTFPAASPTGSAHVEGRLGARESMSAQVSRS